MNIEYACYDRSLTEEEVQNNISEAIKLGVKTVATYQASIAYVKNIIAENNAKLYCPVDFPYGVCDTKSRNFMVEQLCKLGVSGIDLVVQSKYVCNRKYDKIREDIRNNLELTQKNNIDLRYILEYRVFNHETLAKICQIMKSMGINNILPSTGQMIDDINDNIIAAKYLQSKSDINVIVNGNIWNEKHLNNIRQSDIKSIRVHHLSNIGLLA